MVSIDIWDTDTHQRLIHPDYVRQTPTQPHHTATNHPRTDGYYRHIINTDTRLMGTTKPSPKIGSVRINPEHYPTLLNTRPD